MRSCSRGVRSIAQVAVVASAFAWSVPVRAQSANVAARAEALFNAAKQLRDSGMYADACPSFAESARLAPGVGVALYLADCYEHTGKTASAWQGFRSAAKLAQERNDGRAELAEARAHALEPKLSGLTIVVPAAAGHEAPQVLLDGTAIPPQELNTAMAVDPGDHVVTVNAQGQASRTLAAHVNAGDRGAKVRVDEPSPAAADATPSATAPAPAEAPPAPAPSSPSPASSRTLIGLGLIGAGALGIGLGSAFLLRYESSVNPPPSCNPPPKDTGAQVESAVSFGVGGVALISALAVFLSAPHKDSSPAAIVVTPVPLSGGGAAMIHGRF